MVGPRCQHDTLRDKSVVPPYLTVSWALGVALNAGVKESGLPPATFGSPVRRATTVIPCHSDLTSNGAMSYGKKLNRKTLVVFGLEISSLAGDVLDRPCRAAALMFAGFGAIQSGSSSHVFTASRQRTQWLSFFHSGFFQLSPKAWVGLCVPFLAEASG
jgi:hypothetical protein